MKERYLEVTFRKGKPLAAYVYLPRGAGIKSVRTEEAMPGVLVDYAAGGEPIGPGSGPGAGAGHRRRGQRSAGEIGPWLPMGPEELAPLSGCIAVGQAAPLSLRGLPSL